jgi:dolichol-phosphate mannosyltransferase
MAQAPRAARPIEPVLVVIPTYNERENLTPILRRLH